MYTGSENDTLAGDSVSHKAGHRLTVFQDGHVERFNWEKKMKRPNYFLQVFKNSQISLRRNIQRKETENEEERQGVHAH